MAVYNMLLLVSLLWGLVSVVHSQTVPYVSFMGVNLTNHSYVDLTTVEEDRSDHGNTVRCHSDLTTCCTGRLGVHRGDWHFPDGSVLPFFTLDVGSGDIYKRREPQVVHIRRRNNSTSPTGIYRCDIETMAVNDDDVDIITGETVYVGLYLPNEGSSLK